MQSTEPTRYRRILISGNAGAGKTTLARELGERFGLPVVGMDRIVWAPGWQKTTAEARRRALDAALAPPCWIVDGVSHEVIRKADLVLLLNTPRWLCYARCARRNVRYLFRSRPELPAHCPELRILPYLLRLIWRFPRFVLPELLATAESAAVPVVVLPPSGALAAAERALAQCAMLEARALSPEP